MTRCTKCGRRMKRATASTMGPVCERAVLGTKPKRQPSQPVRDTLTADMFPREKDVAESVHALIGGVSLEMPTC